MTEMRLLIADGTPVPLTSKAFDTLVVLIENSDRVVTKDELLRSVWPDVEVEEGNLTQQIFLLRRALGETAQQPRHIVTIPGHGYRFTARVNAISDDPAAPPYRPAAQPRRQSLPWSDVTAAGLAGFGVIALLTIVLGSGWMMRKRQASPWTSRGRRITRSRKRQGHAWRDLPRRPVGRLCRDDGDQYSQWVRQVGTEAKTPVVPAGRGH